MGLILNKTYLIQLVYITINTEFIIILLEFDYNFIKLIFNYKLFDIFQFTWNSPYYSLFLFKINFRILYYLQIYIIILNINTKNT